MYLFIVTWKEAGGNIQCYFSIWGMLSFVFDPLLFKAAAELQGCLMLKLDLYSSQAPPFPKCQEAER